MGDVEVQAVNVHLGAHERRAHRLRGVLCDSIGEREPQNRAHGAQQQQGDDRLPAKHAHGQGSGRKRRYRLYSFDAVTARYSAERFTRSATVARYRVAVQSGRSASAPSRPRPIASNRGSSRNPTGMQSAQPSMAPGIETFRMTIRPITIALWRLVSGVRPKIDPSTRPAATCPGVPSECRALMSDWMSFSRSTRALRVQGVVGLDTTRASRPVVETRTSKVAGRVAATKVAEPYSASTSGPSRRR